MVVAGGKLAKSCCENKSTELSALRTRQGSVLKIVLVINALMFGIEFVYGILSHSSALKADSLDMLGDAIVYGFSLYVLYRTDKWRASAALIKGLIIVGFASYVLVDTTIRLTSAVVPASETMSIVGFIALAANVLCLVLLMRHREDDINMRSTYICSRNDIISNVGVIIAAQAVGITHTKWPDLIVGYIIAILFFKSALPILKESVTALRKIES